MPVPLDNLLNLFKNNVFTHPFPSRFHYKIKKPPVLPDGFFENYLETDYSIFKNYCKLLLSSLVQVLELPVVLLQQQVI